MSTVTTPNIADACIRLEVPFTMAPPSVRALFAEAHCIGRALPVTHFGSVDVFLEAFDSAQRGDVLVIDNQNRTDEACIGDLTAIEAQHAGVAGIVVWGAHRDTVDLVRIGLPIFSTNTIAAGPRVMRPPTREPGCRFGNIEVTRDHVVAADADGVLFIAADQAERVLEQAAAIATTERAQADAVRNGRSLRTQLEWSRYVATRKERENYTLREHIRTLGGAIEV